MYEKHIDTLRIMIGKCGTDGQVEAINAAIELFRAAEPKDEAAEREHCEQLMWRIRSHSDTSAPSALSLQMRERAAARAEGYAAAVHEHGQAYIKGVKEAIAASDKQHAVELKTAYDRGFAAASGLRLADQVARAEAEAQNQRVLDDAYQSGYDDATRTLDSQLAAANARIAELETRIRRCEQIGEVCDQIETKLANLRAAAERMCTDLDDRSEDGPLMPGQASCLVALRAAIEASK